MPFKGTAHVQTTIKIRETMLNFISVDLGELRLRIAVPCAVYKAPNHLNTLSNGCNYNFTRLDKVVGIQFVNQIV
jgi:hypothetical protein